jgi:formimidoylglutamate deiminase
MRLRQIFAKEALLPEGWRRDVLIAVEGDLIVAVTPDSLAYTAEVVNGAVIPGMPNLHSHAFQRAMAGLTERTGPSGDNFWAWRELMYRFLERITPEDNEAIATQLYVEMLKAGYTSVAEFHYLHHDEQGKAYANPAEMSDRIMASSKASGIGLTLLPVFYAHATFGGAASNPGQKHFIHDVDAFNSLVDILLKHKDALRRVGIAPHSLRAVTPEELNAIVAHLNTHDNTAPIHIHAAEQLKEVVDCFAWSRKRPVEWLIDNADVDQRWCLVHATHLNDDEIAALANSGAVAGLCPSTEANLGDGIFNAPDYFSKNGSWGIGGDSHVGVDPFRELGLIEYAQRLKGTRRNILRTPDVDSIGGGLYRQALAGGARALGQKVGAIAINHRADLVVMNSDDVALAEHKGDTLLDAAIFGPARQAVRDVMVGGAWVVREGHHALEDTAFARYRTALKRLLD